MRADADAPGERVLFVAASQRLLSAAGDAHSWILDDGMDARRALLIVLVSIVIITPPSTLALT